MLRRLVYNSPKKRNQEIVNDYDLRDEDEIFTISQALDALFEQAIIIGMPPNEYWDEDPCWFWTYRKVHLMKLKDKLDNMNYQSWLQGYYTMYAVGQCFDEKRRIKYPSEPLDIGANNIIEDERVKKKIEEKNVRKLYANLKTWSSQHKGKFTKDTT